MDEPSENYVITFHVYTRCIMIGMHMTCGGILFNKITKNSSRSTYVTFNIAVLKCPIKRPVNVQKAYDMWGHSDYTTNSELAYYMTTSLPNTHDDMDIKLITPLTNNRTECLQDSMEDRWNHS